MPPSAITARTSSTCTPMLGRATVRCGGATWLSVLEDLYVMLFLPGTLKLCFAFSYEFMVMCVCVCVEERENVCVDGNEDGAGGQGVGCWQLGRG